MVNIILAQPRGFCAGVTRAIEVVNKALEKYGAPIYVKHEIVHNKYVVEDLRKKGVIFVEEISEIPNKAIAIFSAHGVSQKVEDEAGLKNLDTIDATCPLVSKVHRQAQKYEDQGFEIILIGHKGHPEVEGTSGRIKGDMILVCDINDAQKIEPKNPDKLAYVSQTTLSVDDTSKIVEILQRRFPNIEKSVATKDICYATQNRQDAVKELAKQVDLLLVIGAKNSSNSNRLRDLGEKNKVKSYLINDENDLDLKWLRKARNIGITAGASAPEILVIRVIEKLRSILDKKIKIRTMEGKIENVKFALPRKIRKDVSAK